MSVCELQKTNWFVFQAKPTVNQKSSYLDRAALRFVVGICIYIHDLLVIKGGSPYWICIMSLC